MSFTVVWRPSAEGKLAELWNAAADRSAITSAANRIDNDWQGIHSTAESHGRARHAFILSILSLCTLTLIREQERSSCGRSGGVLSDKTASDQHGRPITPIRSDHGSAADQRRLADRCPALRCQRCLRRLLVHVVARSAGRQAVGRVQRRQESRCVSSSDQSWQSSRDIGVRRRGTDRLVLLRAA